MNLLHQPHGSGASRYIEVIGPHGPEQREIIGYERDYAFGPMKPIPQTTDSERYQRDVSGKIYIMEVK